MLEDILDILDIFAPMKTVQTRTAYNNWISKETKNQMELRDKARLLAKQTDLDQHWGDFKARRNICTSMQRLDKKKYLSKIYSDIENEADTGKLFSATRNLLGWSQPGSPSSLKVDGKLLLKQK